ncbi:MAG: gentisate 1,2-dioxygenase [Chloroflexota bacterium]|nr:gentisate 1,2-dioxygenase [Chloroflexota bacterium]
MADNFYEGWVDAGSEVAEAYRNSPVVVHDADVPWVGTRQDARAKLIFGRELGFPTMGGAVTKSEIPVGWQTGTHRHGEESMFILAGSGASEIDGRWYRWRAGSAVYVPYRAQHRHVNLGSEPVVYLSATATPLEIFVNLGGIEHIADCGPVDAEQVSAIPGSTSDHDAEGKRVHIHLDDSPITASEEDRDSTLAANQDQHNLVQYLIGPRAGFDATSVAISHVFTEPAGSRTGRHRHLEALLYVLEGNGFTDIEGRHIPWGPGDLMQIPPAMFAHQHYNDGTADCRLLRIGFGIRPWFTSIWPAGYESRRELDESGRALVAGRYREG